MAKNKQPPRRKPRHTKATVIKAIGECKGLPSRTARALGITRQTFWNYRQKWPELEEVIEDAAQEMGDVAELSLFKNIIDRDQKAIEFYLERRCKHRGYFRQTPTTIEAFLAILPKPLADAVGQVLRNPALFEGGSGGIPEQTNIGRR